MHGYVLLASLAQLSLVRSAAISKSVNHSSSFAESFSLKMAMSCSSEFVRFVCFCVVHNMTVYWHITSPKVYEGAGVEVNCTLNMREGFCSSCCMLSNLSTGWASPTSICHHKLLISLVCMVTFAWLLCRMLLRWSSASNPPKAIVVPDLFMLSLSLLGPISMPPMSSTWKSRSLSSPVCPVSLWWVVIASILYVMQYDWYLFQVSWAWSWVVNVLNYFFCCSILLCAECFYISSIVQSLTRQKQWWACCCVVSSSPDQFPLTFCKASLGNSLPSWVSTDPFHLGCTIWYCSTVRSLITAQV